MQIDPKAENRIAIIKERSKFTEGGVTAVVLLSAAILLTIFGVLVLATTVFGQIIGLLTLACVAIILTTIMRLGREHSYVVYRSFPEERKSPDEA